MPHESNYINLPTAAEIRRINTPGRDVLADIDTIIELTGLIRAKLKNKYKDVASSDVGLINSIIVKIEDINKRYVREIDDVSSVIRVDDLRGGLKNDIMYIAFELLEIAERNDLFDRVAIPTGEAPEVSGVMRDRRVD